jgi:hypothetical protein
MEATVSTHASAIATNTASIASLTSTVSTLGATVSTQATAISTLESKTASYIQKVSAGAGTAELSLVATDSGGSPASTITLKADKIKLGGISQPALEIVNGVSTFSGELNVGGTSGGRVNIGKDFVKVYNASGNLKVQLGNLSL